ncbi:PKD domain-containing protein [Nocardioides jiangxiensis]|uniref:PKD domain-containing protein n=1 Tax=Nocardioides jiangxiensis TaxID=3064524 RepID=A0ABT9B5V7_9ACTN|nr:PKD domain-containing protein [Nocardioides sp. WY-20]MDO7868518.1 PKD domain-containing protein [Nocardioides sp. WY-20]
MRSNRRALKLVLATSLAAPAAFVVTPAADAALLNSPPTAVAQATPNPAHAGNTVTLLGSGSSDSQTATANLSYAWNFGDGSAATASSSSNIAVDHIYPDAGVYTVTLTVTDAGGLTDTDQVVLNVDDTAPVAQATATPSPALVEQAVTFDGSGTADQETADSGLTFAWTFGDGSTGAGVKPTHAYAAAGTYTVKLVVTDPQGASDTKTFALQVTNSAPTAAGTITPASPTAGESVTFDGTASTDKETPQSLTYSWDFADGSPKASTVAPAHTYAASGYYQVKLTVTDPQGLATTKSFALTVGANEKPAARLTASQTKANVGQSVSFDGSTSTDRETAALTYAWDFGDGTDTTALTSSKVTHSWTAAGTYTVTLRVTDANGQTGTATVTITVGNTAPVPAGTVTPQPAYALQQVTLDGSASTDAETPSQLQYSWTFGDGSAATAYDASPVAKHVYAAGSYTATLRVKDPVGAVSLKTFSVSVLANAAPVARPTATPNPAHPGKPVTLDGSGSTDADGDALTYLWTLPDGSSATTASTAYTFPATGTYTASLTVTDAHGISSTSSVTVEATNAAPTAAVAASPLTAHRGQEVTFDGRGSSDPDADALTYLWEFPGGDTATTSVAKHTWADAGSYAVKLTVVDPFGASATKTVTVTVVNRAPVAVATASPQAAHTGETVTFDGTGSSDPDGDALSYTWEFPGGATATTAKATRAFPAVGTYQVKLTVTDAFGASTSDLVTVTASNAAPVASATATPATPHPGDTITFDGTGSSDPDGDALTYRWEFPGGVTATTAKTTRPAGPIGTYQVKLTVTDPYGASSSTTLTVNVSNKAPTAVATFSPAAPRPGTTVTFDGTGSSDPDGDALAYTWEFPDGSTSTVAKPTRSWSAPGSYPVKLTVTDPYGASASTTVTVTVSNKTPVAAATATPTAPRPGDTVTFDGTGSSDPDGDALTYRWEFPGGATATTAKATRTWSATGSYTAKLTVTDPYGASSSTTVSVNVSNQAPVASATATPVAPHVGDAVSFDATGSSDPDGDALTYLWAFPGGATATTAKASHTWSATGSYLVTLTVTDRYGASSSTTVTVNVGNAAPSAVGTATPAAPHPGSVVTFDATRSSDPDGDALTYLWDFGGGDTATTASATHTWASLGSYPVTLTVTDAFGASDTTTLTVVVSNRAPVVSAAVTPAAPLPGDVVTFDGTGSSDPDGDALTYLWDFGGGDTASTAKATRSWSAPGSHTGTLTVTDAFGASSSTTVTVTVANTAPTASFTFAPQPLYTGVTATFDASASSDQESPGSLTYAWSVDGGAPVEGATLARSFGQPGSHSVALRVTDADGASSTAYRTVIVARRVACEGSSVTRGGTWNVVSSNARGGKSCRNATSGRGSLTVLTSGDRFGLTFGRVKGGGTAKIYVDGSYVGAVSTGATSTTVAWTGRTVFAGLGAGPHKVVVRMATGIGNIDDLLVYGPLR